MIRAAFERYRQGHRTMDFPLGPSPELPERFRGRPEIDASRCSSDCSACLGACPTGAVSTGASQLALDRGCCLFCGECERACTTGAIRFTRDHRVAASERGDLVVTEGEETLRLDLDESLRRLFGRSLRLREVCAGGCSGCEADVNVLGTIGWDMSRFGVELVASPRHADGLLVTGPVTRNMQSALLETYEAVADPKIVIAVGACAISGGLFREHPETLCGAGDLLDVDLYVPGCPPHPLTLLEGMLGLLGRLERS